MKIPKPFLPCNAPDDLEDITFPKYVLPKLDGIRCMMNRKAYSRSGKPIRNKHIQRCLAPLAGYDFDGELVVLSEDSTKILPFNEISSAVMSEDGEPNFRYAVFDLWNSNNVYFNRAAYVELKAQYIASKVPQLYTVPKVLVRNLKQLLDYETMFLQAGFEGMIIREPDSWYKHGRATLAEQSFIKLKRHINENGELETFSETEAVVTGYVEYMITQEDGKYIGELEQSKQSSSSEFKIPGNMLGALCVRVEDGTDLKVGSGFTFEERKLLWAQKDTLEGRIIKFKYMRYGTLNKPRHPVFLGFRERDDMDNDPFGVALV